jgi:hypothetical protein
MKKCLLFLLAFCVLAAPGLAKRKKASAEKGGTAVEAIGSPDGPAAPAVKPDELDLVLKDGQALKGAVQGYDSYFLDVKIQKGATFHVPWPEIKSVSREGRPEDWAQAFLTAEQNVVVTTTVTPLNPGQAFLASLFPGFFIHGWGHYQARDTDRFYALLGAEVFGVMVGGFGVTEASGVWGLKSSPGVAGENDNTARALAYAGAAIFAGSWLWDVCFASSAADRFNREHGLVLNVAPVKDGMLLGMNCRF